MGKADLIHDAYKELTESIQRMRCRPDFIPKVLKFCKLLWDAEATQLSGEVKLQFHRGRLLKTRRELPEEW